MLQQYTSSSSRSARGCQKLALILGDPDTRAQVEQTQDACIACVAQAIYWALTCHLPAARLAQSVERKALNLVVVGSSPAVGVSCRRRLGWRGAEARWRAPLAHTRV